ncbi:hypothetical protein RHSIM_Rhsim09G0138900 [Rhododendron simsii]|uniref:Leucine-rich repeat-containing N-terminal plant-type domain-containing protein n=1 Tax=Rhododendron simsii TaxID=118357 RepID=A0A834GH43_RHOSS|nr:hypothetical protein RHSIM_Rhsim09G0138900 [Rhododendron simsii]
MATIFAKMLSFFVVMLLASSKTSSGLTSNPKIRCIEKEKQALLKFKEALIDDGDSLSSWGSENDEKECCKWRGVECNNHTGHVAGLNLSTWSLAGKISPSFLELQHLEYLDLSGNNFGGDYTPIPNHHLGNVSSLQYLSLGGNYNLSGGNLEWLSYFPLLRHLDLSTVDLSEATNWLELVSDNLPLLEYWNLSNCYLPNQVPPTHPLNSSLYLTVVDLSDNQMSSVIPDAFGKMISLVHLNLAYNDFVGRIPKSFANLSRLESLELKWSHVTEQVAVVLDKLSRSEKSLQILNFDSNQLSGTLPDFTRFSSLRELYLGGNKLTGAFPKSFRHVLPNLVVLEFYGNQISGMLPDLTAFPLLTRLDLSNNSLNGTIDKSIGQLSKMEHLDTSLNSFEGIISESHFSNLSSLKYLDLSFNSLVFNISSSWIPPFQLDAIRLKLCTLGPDFPEWLRNQNNFSELDVSGAGISDVVPSWFWDLPPNLVKIDISDNRMKGSVPDLSSAVSLFFINLSSNSFTGQLPRLPSSLTALDLSKNLFSGSISFICAITGPLFWYVDLSSNQLSGELPNCWEPFHALHVISLANNTLSGELPRSFGNFFDLKTLQLSNNNFSGELPESLKNCPRLIIMDLGGNKFTGKIQPWLGTHIPNLMILSVRSNKFYGDVPRDICLLNSLRVLDFSQNDLSGKLPTCFDNFTALVQRDYRVKETADFAYYSTFYLGIVLVQWKGQERGYQRRLRLLKMVDFSSNKFSGEIPQEIASLAEVVSLNLSRNDFTGKIVQNIDRMKMLESLDLSRNRLFGKIPPTLAALNFLSVLDLSNNNLSGKIPTSTQLQSFDASVYSGNAQLCGVPLPNECPGEEQGGKKGIQEEDDQDQFLFTTPAFYISLGVGFACGFWAIFGTILFSSVSRYAWFKFLDEVADWLYVTTAVNFNRLKRRLRG